MSNSGHGLVCGSPDDSIRDSTCDPYLTGSHGCHLMSTGLFTHWAYSER